MERRSYSHPCLLNRMHLEPPYYLPNANWIGAGSWLGRFPRPINSCAVGGLPVNLHSPISVAVAAYKVN